MLALALALSLLQATVADAPVSSEADSPGEVQTREPLPKSKENLEPLPAGTSLVDRPGRGLFTGDEYRFGKHNLVLGLLQRIFLDLVAIPTGIVGWSASDWGVFGAVMAISVALMVPINNGSLAPNLDVKLQRTVTSTLGGNDRFTIWTPYGDFLIWVGIWSGVASLFVYGLAGDHPEYVEAAALAFEAFAIAQVYANLVKLVLGREGPKDNVPQGQLTSDGRILGPAGFVRLFPSGFPSGHVATMYAIVSAVMTYFDQPALWVGLNMFALLFSATIIADNYHFASETIFAAAMGFCIGRWVVEHRSSKYRNADDGLPRRIINEVTQHVAIAPMALPNGGMGAAFVGRF